MHKKATDSSVDERTWRSVGVSATHGNVANFRNLADIVTTPQQNIYFLPLTYILF